MTGDPAVRMALLRHVPSGEVLCVVRNRKGVRGGFKAGYLGRDWQVVDSDHAGPPPDHCDWIDGEGFVVDQARALAAAEQARLAMMTRAEIVAELRNDFEAKLAALRAELGL